MKEDIGKFICPKCNKMTSVIYNQDTYVKISLFRAREENGKKKWIFKFYEYSFATEDNIIYWIGDITEKYKNYKECWEETGGFSTKELKCYPDSTFTCKKCKYQSDNLIPFLCQQEKFTTEEEINKLTLLENKIKILEKAFEEEKNKNKIEKKEISEDKIFILNEKINLIMNDLKEIKTAVNDIKNKK